MHNLNFAMGRDITHSLVYQELQEMLNVYRGDSMNSPYERICEEIQNRLEIYTDRESQRVREYVSEILFIWESIGFGHCKFVEILELLLEGLKEYSIDDVTGGKIRVMGVLAAISNRLPSHFLRSMKMTKSYIIKFFKDRNIYSIKPPY